MGLARHSPQLLPGSFFPDLTRCSASTFAPAAPLLWGWKRLMGWGRAMASHPTPWPDVLFCSVLIERRRQKGVKSAHGQPGGDMEEGAYPANKDLAKCSHCVCTVSLLWAEAALVASHTFIPPPSLFAPPTSLSARPSHPLSPLRAAWEQTRVGFSPSPLFSHSPYPPHQPWCPQQQ